MRRRVWTWLCVAAVISGCGSSGGEIAKALIGASAAVLAAAAYHAASGECWAACSHGYMCDRSRGVCIPDDERAAAAPVTMKPVARDRFCIEEDDGSIVCPDDPETNFDGSATGAPRQTYGPCQGLCYAHERCRMIEGMAYCVTEDDPLYEDPEDDTEPPEDD